MNYKMVVTDLDGTLLNSNKNISSEDICKLKELHNKGIKIVIATGRGYYMAKELIKPIRDIEPVILANNGAVVRESESDRLLANSYLDSQVFDAIYKTGISINLNPVLYVDEYENGYDLIYEQINIDGAYGGYIKKNYDRSKCVKFEPNKIKNILSVCYVGDVEELDLFSKKIYDVLGRKCNIILNKNLNVSGLLEFLHPDGCKWTALNKYAASVGVNANEIVTFGDDNNDIEMLRNAGLGIAMRNATEKCKQISDRISSKDSDNSGVSFELNKIF